MDPQRGNVKKLFFIQVLLSAFIFIHYLTVSQAATGIKDYNNIKAYGCPECHPSSLSCHIDWNLSKLEDIKKSWIQSFHTTLSRDTFNPCYSFFIKGECLNCHPSLFEPKTIDYKIIYKGSWQ